MGVDVGAKGNYHPPPPTSYFFLRHTSTTSSFTFFVYLYPIKEMRLNAVLETSPLHRAWLSRCSAAWPPLMQRRWASSGGPPQSSLSSSSLSFNAEESPSEDDWGAVQREPPTATEREALQQRRRLYTTARALGDVVQSELKAEVARDVRDGVAAVPPLAPSGWAVSHFAGQRYFTMTKRGRNGGGYPYQLHPTEQRYHPLMREAEVEDSATPQYRSINDEMRGLTSHNSATNSTSSSDAAQQKQVADGSTASEKLILRGGRYAAEAGDDGLQRGRVDVMRSDIDVTVFAPFRTVDLSFFDATVDVSEWVGFDVLVQKRKPMTAGASRRSPTLLQGQREVWDTQRAMFFRLACVNGDLRIRSLQFVSEPLARALDEYAVFGSGEPLYQELLRRQWAEHQRRNSKRASSTTHTRASPLQAFDAPDTFTKPAISSANAAQTGQRAEALASSLLISRFDRCAEYARLFAYGGPYISDLSKELRDVLMDFLINAVGITVDVSEYVCQLQYFLEQEEYMGWLAQWGQLAASLQRSA